VLQALRAEQGNQGVTNPYQSLHATRAQHGGSFSVLTRRQQCSRWNQVNLSSFVPPFEREDDDGATLGLCPGYLPRAFLSGSGSR